MLRRLNIACGIAHKPKLIFLDEPTVAVDPQSRNNILDGIQTLRNQGATIVYTTHYMEEVEILCDRVIIIDKGKIIASGTIDELKALSNMDEKVSVEVKKIDEKQIERVKTMAYVEQVNDHDQLLEVSYKEGKNNIVSMIEFLAKESIQYSRIYSQRPTLNDVFLELTGKELRD